LNSEKVSNAAVQSFDFAKFLNAERITEYADVIISLFLDISPDSSKSAGIGNF
jgi:hypothetical protein